MEDLKNIPVQKTNTLPKFINIFWKNKNVLSLDEESCWAAVKELQEEGIKSCVKNEGYINSASALDVMCEAALRFKNAHICEFEKVVNLYNNSHISLQKINLN